MTLITVSIIAIAAAEIAVGCYFVARNGESGKFETEAARDARLAEEDYLADAREELTELVAPRYGSDSQARASIDSEPKSVRPLGLRVTPTDLQAAYEPVMPRYPWRSRPLEPGLEDLYPLYDQKGVNVRRPVEEILRDLPGEDTLVFRALVDNTWSHADIEALETWCGWCETGDHADCPGCACPCGLGVDIIAIGNLARLKWRAAA